MLTKTRPGANARARNALARGSVAVALLATCSAVVPASIPTVAPMKVSASVVRGCMVSGAPQQTASVSFGSVNFGTHPAVGAATPTAIAGGGMTLQARIECTPGTTAHVSTNAGLHALGAQRRMSNNAGRYVPYSLALVSAATVSLEPNAVVDLPLGATATALPIIGTANLPGTGLAAGIYTDTVQVTLTW